MDKEKLTTDYDENINHIDKVLRVNDSFDMIKKDMVVSDCRITFYYIDGFVNSAIMQKLMMHLQNHKQKLANKQQVLLLKIKKILVINQNLKKKKKKKLVLL